MRSLITRKAYQKILAGLDASRKVRDRKFSGRAYKFPGRGPVLQEFCRFQRKSVDANAAPEYGIQKICFASDAAAPKICFLDGTVNQPRPEIKTELIIFYSNAAFFVLIASF